MEGDRHFSHDHPLTSFLDDRETDDNYHSCKLCGLPILCAPSYTCTFAACDFFLHQSCAHKIQEAFIHPKHRPEDEGHTLRLQEGSPNFTYKCEDCNSEMHPLVVVDGIEIRTKHKSHLPHPLVVFCRDISSLCDGCGEKHDGFFFSCQCCNFLIHQDCTILPTAVTLPSDPWPFFLVYSLPVIARLPDCTVCNKPLLFTHNAIYYCPQNYKFVHVGCAFEKIQSST